MKQRTKKCAIYTRKSTDEGLDQEFNTLDAQREACEAYITSQKADGWKVLNDQYNDGGFSGGSLKRPALSQMLDDIKAGKIDIIVVYKIDRLTRSLMDFAKLVEIFDEHHVTFVSVTQSFNTTTSMGRLTLNVLLSFAQFEREVTGERIRDKIAASKKKGMWMGGIPPLGYKCEDRKLLINNIERKTIEFIFNHYLEYGSVRKLKEGLDDKGHKTPKRETQKGRIYGDCLFSRGNIYRILNNPLYAGKIQHKDKIYDGLHEAIISEDQFHEAQDKMALQKTERRIKLKNSKNLLIGKLFDCDGTIYSPSHTSKKGKKYRYYISQNLLQYKDHPKGVIARLPAHEIEKTIFNVTDQWVTENIHTIFPECSDHTLNYIKNTNIKITENLIEKAIICESKINIHINLEKLSLWMAEDHTIHLGSPTFPEHIIEIPFHPRIINNGAIIVESPNTKDNDPLDLPKDKLKNVVQGIVWRDEHFSGMTLKDIAKRGGHGENYVNRCIQDSFTFLSQ